MNKLCNSVISGVGSLLSVFFSLIVCYAAYGIFDAADSDNVVFISCFLGFNIVMIVIVATFGGAISEKCGTPALASSWVAIVIYTVIQMTSTFAHIIGKTGENSGKFYVLGNLILAFVLLLVMLPILSSGAKHEGDK
ncbi:MAG: hypothetical protein GX896_06990 [Clostridiales bacterium]|nr:hypothetical protein [Clostridiales bacterium]